MSEQNPYQQLGVGEDASFDEIQSAKSRLSQQYREDNKVLESIEMAYDAIIMERLKMRQEGRIKVPDRIRFPERTLEKPPIPTSLSLPSSPSWLQVWIDTPSTQEIVLPALVFALLAGGALLATSHQILPTLLVGGVFANVYFLNRKEGRFGRSLLISLGILLIGVSLGAVLPSLLGGLSLPVSGEVISCVLSFVLFWMASSFLR
jgi:hypothetical protein